MKQKQKKKEDMSGILKPENTVYCKEKMVIIGRMVFQIHGNKSPEDSDNESELTCESEEECDATCVIDTDMYEPEQQNYSNEAECESEKQKDNSESEEEESNMVEEETSVGFQFDEDADTLQEIKRMGRYFTEEQRAMEEKMEFESKDENFEIEVEGKEDGERKEFGSWTANGYYIPPGKHILFDVDDGTVEFVCKDENGEWEVRERLHQGCYY